MDFQHLLPVMTALVSGATTYLIARGGNKKDNEQFFTDKLQTLFEEQQTDIKGLKEEIRKLTKENGALRLEILELKQQLKEYQENKEEE